MNDYITAFCNLRFLKSAFAFYRLFLRTASKSSSISFDGAFVKSDTTTIQIDEKMNAGNNS